MLKYLNEVIVPFVKGTRKELGVDEQQPALAIFDHFKGQKTELITKLLEDHLIHSVLIPANYTGHLQPMDISVNKVIKSFLRKQFTEWHSRRLSKQLIHNDEYVPVELSMARMKRVGGAWLVKRYNHLQDNPHIVVHGFRHGGILKALRS